MAQAAGRRADEYHLCAEVTLEEAQTVAGIAATADGGCAICVAELTDRLQGAFPEFTWSVDGESSADVEIKVTQP